MRTFLVLIPLILASGYVNAEIPCIWGEQATSTCDCELYKDEMLNASAGDPNAQYRIWQLMTFSEGFRKSPSIPADEGFHKLSEELQQCKNSITWHGRRKLADQGIEWLRSAARNGHISAQFYLGMHIWFKENERGKRHYSKKNLIGCEIERNFGREGPCRIYWRRVTREDVDRLRKWVNSKTFDNEFNPQIEELIRSAAEAKHIQAQFALALILEEGIGVPMDEVQAQAWRIVAVAQNPPFGANIRDGHLARYWLTHNELQEARAMAEKFMTKYTDLWKNPSVTIIQ